MNGTDDIAEATELELFNRYAHLDRKCAILKAKMEDCEQKIRRMKERKMLAKRSSPISSYHPYQGKSTAKANGKTTSFASTNNSTNLCERPKDPIVDAYLRTLEANQHLLFSAKSCAAAVENIDDLELPHIEKPGTSSVDERVRERGDSDGEEGDDENEEEEAVEEGDDMGEDGDTTDESSEVADELSDSSSSISDETERPVPIHLAYTRRAGDFLIHRSNGFKITWRIGEDGSASSVHSVEAISTEGNLLVLKGKGPNKPVVHIISNPLAPNGETVPSVDIPRQI